MKPTFFSTKEEFREWLEKHHEDEKELLTGFYKTGSGKPSMSWSESVDQALCFGWIDGVRKSIDHESYSIRFTPRKSSSIWSNINIKKVKELTKAGLMTSAGQRHSILEKRTNPEFILMKKQMFLLIRFIRNSLWMIQLPGIFLKVRLHPTKR